MKTILALALLTAGVSAWANLPPENIEEFPFPRNVLDTLDETVPPQAPAPAAPVEDKTVTLKKLLGMNREQLDALYKTLPAGPIPDGDSNGRATLSSGSGFGRVSEDVLHALWQGKVFKKIDEKHGELVNKILGNPAIKAQVYYEKSLLDGKESIILDYSKFPDLIIRGIRDEIRMASPGVYFGYAYMHGPFGWTKKPLIFALDFNK
jgi:hypothetical protein